MLMKLFPSPPFTAQALQEVQMISVPSSQVGHGVFSDLRICGDFSVTPEDQGPFFRGYLQTISPFLAYHV